MSVMAQSCLCVGCWWLLKFITAGLQSAAKHCHWCKPHLAMGADWGMDQARMGWGGVDPESSCQGILAWTCPLASLQIYASQSASIDLRIPIGTFSFTYFSQLAWSPAELQALDTAGTEVPFPVCGCKEERASLYLPLLYSVSVSSSVSVFCTF